MAYRLLAIAPLLILFSSSVNAAPAPANSAVASAHPAATAAGLQVLAQGGNAFDAAIAVTAALAVVEPYSSGLGGGGFWLLHRAADGKQLMVDGRERAPLEASHDMYLNADGEVIAGASVDGPLAAGIPGVPAALEHLAKNYGALSLSVSLAPAIRLARAGFKSDGRYQQMARFREAALLASPAAASIFLRGGKAPAIGSTIVQTDLAAVLELIAESGAAGFYRGQIGSKLVAGVRQSGGIWTLADLAEYRVVERAPVQGNYRGMRIVSAAPPSSGGVVLINMLNILAGFELEQMPRAQRLHLLIEAMRRAYRDRAEFLGDPDYVDAPLDRLLHPYYAAGQRSSIRLDQATPSAHLPGIIPDQEGPHTTHFSIIDRQGNRVAATLSINYPFGSGFVAPGTGVLLNDEMDDFSASPGTPNVYGLVGAEANAIAPGKRMLSSMSPTFLETDNRIAILGTPGGSRIITMVLQGALEFYRGSVAAEIVTLPRIHHQYLPDVVQFEPGALSAAEQQILAKQGHSLKPLQQTFGNMQAVVWNHRDGRVEAASDPRGGGSARLR